ncbi:hypothetical protein [Sphingobacterium sp.]|uniref:hypothetical protein n=1 Tax=Sphingobacterium sp. TaxID=341027 RepID=UPI0028A67749|nr:hypothetical protein [Sphingobacterium sp.]
MKNNSLLLYLSISITLILSILLIVLVNNSNKYRNTIKVLRNEIADSEGKTQKLKELNSLSYSANNIIRNNKIDSSFIKEILKYKSNSKKKVLVFRIHENDCNECVNFSLTIIKKLKKEKNFEVLLLPNYKDLKRFDNEYGSTEYGILPISDFGLDLTGVSKPYLFIVDENFKVSSVFFPNYLFMDQLEQYLKNV